MLVACDRVSQLVSTNASNLSLLLIARNIKMIWGRKKLLYLNCFAFIFNIKGSIKRYMYVSRKKKCSLTIFVSHKIKRNVEGGERYKKGKHFGFSFVQLITNSYLINVWNYYYQGKSKRRKEERKKKRQTANDPFSMGALRESFIIFYCCILCANRSKYIKMHWIFSDAEEGVKGKNKYFCIFLCRFTKTFPFHGIWIA